MVSPASNPIPQFFANTSQIGPRARRASCSDRRASALRCWNPLEASLKRTFAFVLIALTVSAWSAPAAAGPLLDFSTLAVGGNITNLGTGAKSVGAVTAQAYQKSSSVWSAARLIARNETNDHGLGVCSSAEYSASLCNVGSTGGGDWNELSQLYNTEAIMLTLAPNWKWSQLWVSSLDGGGTGGGETGKIYWGNSSDPATLISQATSQGKTFTFESGQFANGAVEGNILSLAQASIFDKSAKYVLFMPGGSKGDNEDYLLYGAGANVPEPGIAALLLLGAAAGLRLRHRRSSQISA